MKQFIYILMLTLLSVTVLAQTEELENLGVNINTAYSEISPVISPDGKTLYFVRKYHPDNLGYERRDDIWYSELQSDGTWSQAQNIGKPLNTSSPDGIQAISADGNTVLLRGYYEDGVRKKGNGYSFVQKSDSTWGIPQGIDIEGYREMAQGDRSNATMSTNQDVIILSFSEETDSQINDLYVTQKQDDGSWSRSQYITFLNTDDYTETVPFLAADDKTLYFSSNRSGGLGNNDIYVTHRLDDTWMNWSEPENIGAPINTTAWDAYYTLPASGEYTYTVSYNNSIGRADIFQIKLEDRFKPEAVVMIYGKVYNGKTQVPISATIQYHPVSDSTELGKINTQITGEYTIFLPCNEKYIFRSYKTGYTASEEVIDLTDVSSYQEVEQDLYLFPQESLKPDTLVMVYGKVYNGKTKTPMDATIQYHQASDATELENISTQATGEYKLFLPYGQKYTYSPNKTGFISSETVIDLTTVDTYQEIEQDLYLFPLETGVKIALENIFFKQGKSDLLEESYSELNHLYLVMSNNPTLRVQLNGHTDINGSDRALNGLSKRRVVAVRGYLVGKGISEDRIETKAFGKTQPITIDPDEQEKNRRVEVEVLGI